MSEPGAVVQPLAVPGGVQVIARVGQLFRALEAEPLGLTLTELANRLELPRSTVHRLVGALATEGLVTNSVATGQVRIGPELIRIASAARLDLRQQVEPLMRGIFDAIGETVDCSVLEAGQLRVVEVIPTQHQLRVVAEVGAVFPLHCSSKGKAVLALLPDDEIEALVPRTLHRFTPQTITTRSRLLQEIAEVRQRGVALDVEEHTLGVCAAAIGARDAYGSVFAISVPAPTLRFQGERDALVETLQAARAELAELAGAR